MSTETSAVPRESLTLVEHGLFPDPDPRQSDPARADRARAPPERGPADRPRRLHRRHRRPTPAVRPRTSSWWRSPASTDRIWWEKNARLDPARTSSGCTRTSGRYLDAPRAVRAGPLRRRRPGVPAAGAVHHARTPGTRCSSGTCSSAPCRPSWPQFRPGFTVLHAPELPGRSRRATAPAAGTFIVLNFAKRTGADRRHPLRRRDQEVDLHRAQLPAAGSRACCRCTARPTSGPTGDTAIFFGLSGTGKTTLSADPDAPA